MEEFDDQRSYNLPLDETALKMGKNQKDSALGCIAEMLGLAGLPVPQPWQDLWWKESKHGKKCFTKKGQKATNYARKQLKKSKNR